MKLKENEIICPECQGEGVIQVCNCCGVCMNMPCDVCHGEKKIVKECSKTDNINKVSNELKI